MTYLKVLGSLFLILASGQLHAQSVTDYRLYPAIGISKEKEQAFIIIRSFRLDGTLHYLTVNMDTLESGIEAEKSFGKVEANRWATITDKYGHSHYVKALNEADQNADLIQNAGITHVRPLGKGVHLTIDLCPSRHPLDRDLFIQLINAFSQVEVPVPVAISITGVWMEEHGNDLRWLLELEKDGRLAVTWINHSFHHRTSKDLPLNENFLLKAGTDINEEVLQTEVKMIENGIVPSVFFRFPGLVSDERLFDRITEYGLIPVGSDAWLGKNQWPQQGSIVLVHANGNEPIGIQRFLELMKSERENIIAKKWLLLDLRETIEETEDNRLQK
jgi:hypothetical protein